MPALSACLVCLVCVCAQTSDRSLVWNTDLIETMELENLLINAAITMHSAERRKVGRSAAGAPAGGWWLWRLDKQGWPGARQTGWVCFRGA